MVSVVISIGANCGDRKTAVEKALNWLKTILVQTKYSDIYETPCALSGKGSYLNIVVSGFYQGTGFELSDMLKSKEHEIGRRAQCKEKGEVPIDIDLVVCDGEVLKPWDYRQKFFKIGFDQIN